MNKKVKRRMDILLVGQTPPPQHGQAVVTAMLFDHDWGDLKVGRLRMAYSDSIDSVGKASIGKVFHLVALILKTLSVTLLERPVILYYLPASANKIPVLRDIIYLGCVRWCFSKTVFHYHAGGLPEYLDKAGWVGTLAKKCYSGADVSIEICHTEISPGSIFQAAETVLIPNGLDVEKVERQRADTGKFRIIFMGLLNEGKGALDILKASSLLKASGLDFEVYCVGGWASEKFMNESLLYMEEAGLEEYVYFPGIIRGLDKWQFYADADVFLFPTHYQSENFPLVLIEAMAFSLPIISTRWRGIPELIGDSGAGILCEIKEPKQYADAIIRLMNDKNLRDQMGSAAVARYESKYTREKFVRAMETVFRRLLK